MQHRGRQNATVGQPATWFGLVWFCLMDLELRMVFVFLNGYILSGYLRTYLIALISAIGPQNLKYLLSGPFSVC